VTIDPPGRLPGCVFVILSRLHGEWPNISLVRGWAGAVRSRATTPPRAVIQAPD
jgi:hypothetical protein